MKEKHLLYAGFISPVIFWVTTLICGLMIDDYNHFSNMVSELGALGSEPQYIFSTGLVLSSVLNILFVIGLYRICKSHHINTTPVLFLLFFSFLAGPGIVPMPLRLHGIIGIPFPLFMLSPLLALIIWRNNESQLRIRAGAITGLLLMLLGFLIFFPSILPEYFGLKQRFLYLGWTFWSGYLAFKFLDLIENNNDVKNKI
ncbi:MAG: DUF998 domain-containing protein [Bacteroidales bacterium]